MSCEQYFSNNVYHTFNELIYHTVFIFFKIWKHGFNKTEVQFNNLKSSLIKNKLNKQLIKNKMIFLYEEFYCEDMSQKERNLHTVMEYQKVLDQAFLFTCINFRDLVDLSFNMTNLRGFIENKRFNVRKNKTKQQNFITRSLTLS